MRHLKSGLVLQSATEAAARRSNLLHAQSLAKYGVPEIMNTDQGSQFTSGDFIDVLERHAIAISMDGKGFWRDNVFVERLWKTVKYEHVYLHTYDSVSEAPAKEVLIDGAEIVVQLGSLPFYLRVKCLQ